MVSPARVLTVIFWTVFAMTVVWVAVSARDYDVVRGMFGEEGLRFVTTLLMGAMALLSGFLVLHHRRDDGDYWTGAELVYALALFLSLFYGIYSFFGWLYYA